ncbi:DNA polymerase III subunit gamma and tau [Actinotalea sp.]|uniref:DNA polymerase III subunit gamma and tau n=1 Tax=Actinotalea sp. TaxID=1872145 RepID=UPI0035695CA8
MTQALYRRYRPETFTEVIGQEHVTEPLMQALRAGKITHAYLFSGPRGCGKTTSARILARCLNCAQGPTPTPCGECESCRELGRGGPGSLDVVEIDAASHNGVDDARDLRERAAFAPARDRFKIFILDEAHMVTPQGFNALLKIVEEPPPHVKFIFATTEPDKVIGTIRSRTHHYPFRLVAPDTLTPYLEQLSAAEGVPVAAGVLPLVVRAGGGSVRDSLSVLDQLVAGADATGLDYERAVALLGYTHAALLDDIVDAISSRDGASAFRVVDRVISSGHEPRRFVEDVLERLRDLIVIAASGEAAQAVLRDLPADQLERMRVQARTLGPAELSRAADLANAALSEMTGATSPRLHLELLVARMLLPAVDGSGVVARLERMERAVEGGTLAPRVEPARSPAVTSRPEPAPVPAPASAPAPAPAPAPARAPVPETASAADDVASPAPTAPPVREAAPVREVPPVREAAPGAEVRPGPAPVPEPAAPPAASPVGEAAPAAPAAAATSGPAAGPAPEAEMVRRRWPEVLQTLRGVRRSTWVLVSENAQVAAVEGGLVSLAFTTPQLATTFRTGPHGDHVRNALRETLGLDVRVESVIAPAAGPSGPAAAEAAPDSTRSPRAASTTSAGTPSRAQAEASWADPAPAPSGSGAPTRSGPAAETPTAPAPVTRATTGPSRSDSGGTESRTAEPRTDTAVPGDAPTAGLTPPRRPSVESPAGPASSPAAARTVTAVVSEIASDGIPDGPEPDLEAADGHDDGPAPRRAAPSARQRAAAPQAPAPTAGPRAPSARPAPSSQPAPSARPAPSSQPAPQATPGDGGPLGRRGIVPTTPRPPAPSDGSDASPDDPELASSGLIGAPLVAQMLGGTVIDEIPDPPV